MSNLLTVNVQSNQRALIAHVITTKDGQPVELPVILAQDGNCFSLDLINMTHDHLVHVLIENTEQNACTVECIVSADETKKSQPFSASAVTSVGENQRFSETIQLFKTKPTIGNHKGLGFSMKFVGDEYHGPIKHQTSFAVQPHNE